MQAHSRFRPLPLAIALSTALWMPQAHAFKFQLDNPEYKMSWDNTLKYSAGYRLNDPSPTLVNDGNYNDGDLNFKKGLISNRVDLLSEFEVSKGNDMGVRLSGAAWYDQVYNSKTDYTANRDRFASEPAALFAPANSTSASTDHFTKATEKLHGKNAEVLDAFVWSKFNLGDMSTTVRLGRHSLVFGETLFFGANGIAEAQGPIDLVKLLTVPSSQFKEVLRPVNQISGNIIINPTVSVSAYYQFEWDKTQIPAVGSYLSNIDWAGDGSEILYTGPTSAMLHIPDITPKDSGQGGLRVRIAPEGSDFEYGLYAAQFHAKTPSGFYFDTDVVIPNVINYTTATPSFRTVYCQDIKTYGASATTSIGQLNLATEISFRDNVPLNSDPQLTFGGTYNNSNNVLYAVGKTGHFNLSGIYVLQPNALWGGGAWLVELAGNRTLAVTKNRAALDANTTRDAWALRTIFSPAYFQVLPGLDIEVPMGLGWNFSGRSSAIGNFNGGSSHAGDMSLGVTGTYQNTWKMGLNYVHYFGDEFSFVTPQNSSQVVLSFKQTLKDRDFVSLNISRAF